MGNLVSFRSEFGSTPLKSTRKNCSPSSNDLSSNDPSFKNVRPEPVQTLPSVDNIARKLTSRTFPPSLRNLTSFVHGTPRTTIFAGPDPYTLVLLADQELHSGRDDQAEALLIEAFATFDRQANRARGEVAHGS
jgi:hypothetical protein